MGLDIALARARIVAERLMVDTCTIRRSVSTSTDPNSGDITPTYATIYGGKCRVQQPSVDARSADAGEAYLLMLRLSVQVPMTVAGVRAGDEVLINSAVFDPDLPGRTFVVRELAHKTHATARRLGVEEKTS